MDIFQLCAEQESYSFGVGNNVREQQLEGGMPRNVIAFLGAVLRVNATVMLDGDGAYQYFWAFWRQNQTREWQWKLIIDQGNLEDVTCRFNNQEVPQPVLLGHNVWKITFTVYVKPIIRSKDTDENIINMWNGATPQGRFEIEKIPNEYFPEAIGVE